MSTLAWALAILNRWPQTLINRQSPLNLPDHRCRYKAYSKLSQLGPAPLAAASIRIVRNSAFSGANMAANHLRLVSDHDYLDFPAEKECPRVTVSMHQVLPLLVDAVRSNRNWLSDFSEETVEISSDLYQVLLAYKESRRSA